MGSSRRRFLGFSLLGAAVMMPASMEAAVEITVRREGAGGPMIPEEVAMFQAVMTNQGSAPVIVNPFAGSRNDPLACVADGSGKVLGTYPPSLKTQRSVGDRHGLMPAPQKQVSLEPGKQETWWANLWKYRTPLPPGSYEFRVEHRLIPGAARVQSQPVGFQIVEAVVGDWAMTYTNAARAATTLVWAGTPADGSGPERILVRDSGLPGHSFLREGATALPEPPKVARLSAGQPPVDAKVMVLHWIATTTAAGAELIQHNSTNLEWRSKEVALGLIDPVPVPRFPDRGHAVYLATGRGAQGPELVGLKVKAEEEPQAPWRVGIARTPFLTAVSYAMQGPISVLMVAQVGSSSVISMVTVNEDGKVLLPEASIERGDKKVLALAVDMRPGAPPKFLVLEEDAQTYGRVSLVHIPVAGRIATAPPAPLTGWPSKGEGDLAVPMPAREVTLEVSADGAPWVALTDDENNLYGGSLVDFHLKLVRMGTSPDGHKRQSIHPHIGALANGVTVSCFTETGELYHYVAEKRHGH